MPRPSRLCRKCGLSEWSEPIDKVVYYSGRGKGITTIEVESPARICTVCFFAIHIAKTFEKNLPKGFGWNAAKIFYKGGGKVDECERMLPNRDR